VWVTGALAGLPMGPQIFKLVVGGVLEVDELPYVRRKTLPFMATKRHICPASRSTPPLRLRRPKPCLHEPSSSLVCKKTDQSTVNKRKGMCVMCDLLRCTCEKHTRFKNNIPFLVKRRMKPINSGRSCQKQNRSRNKRDGLPLKEWKSWGQLHCHA
jgi:hypothetical protein